jgi:hypothetical protein
LDGLGLTHELLLLALPQAFNASQDHGIHEAIATGETNLLFRKLFIEHPELFAGENLPASTRWITSGPAADMLNNRRKLVFGGSAMYGPGNTVVSDFYANA